MKWYVVESDNVRVLIDYLDFNQFDYQQIVTWDQTLDTYGRHTIPADILSTQNSVLILDHDTLAQVLKWPVSRSLLITFLKNNYLWIWSDLDSLVLNRIPSVVDNFKSLDLSVNSNKVTYFLDGLPPDSSWEWKLKNIKLKIFPYNHWVKTPGRIRDANIKKSLTAKDFLLTTIFKKSAPSRRILFNQLKQKPNLLSSGNIIFHNNVIDPYDRDSWVGQKNDHRYAWQAIPSMDLYRNSRIEIIPETLYKNGYLITEKTVKALITGTPFLIVGPKGQLEYMKQLGFKTYDSLIDESYDREHRIQDRIKKMLITLEDIISNGSQNFLNASESIIKHNIEHVYQISGNWERATDAFIAQCIAEISG